MSSIVLALSRGSRNLSFSPRRAHSSIMFEGGDHRSALAYWPEAALNRPFSEVLAVKMEADACLLYDRGANGAAAMR